MQRKTKHYDPTQSAVITGMMATGHTEEEARAAVEKAEKTTSSANPIPSTKPTDQSLPTDFTDYI